MQLTLKDENDLVLDLTGWTFRGKIRKRFADTASVIDFTIAPNSPATDGIINVSLTAVQTAALPIAMPTSAERKLTQWAYDIEGQDPTGVVFRFLEGAANISPEVTR